MKIAADKLPGHLARELAAVYLIAGDEHLLVAEAADAVREAARAAGCSERELLFAGRGFDWSHLTAGTATLSLFAERRLIELRLASAKPGKAGAAALVRYTQRPPGEDVLLVIAPKIDRSAAASAWVKALATAGVFVQLWPIEAARLPGWIAKRMRASGLEPTRGAVALLAERVEGNLLAADQEIQKLLMLEGPGRVSEDAVRRAVADSARFDVFQLGDAALAGDGARALRILAGLHGEGVEPPLVLWVVTRELRTLAELAWRIQHGESAHSVLRGVWQRRRAQVGKALERLSDLALLHHLMQRAVHVDRVVKGIEPGRPWEALTGLVSAVAGVDVA